MASKINKGEILAKFFDDGEYTALFADGAVSAACGYAAGQQAYAVYQNGEAVTVKDVEKNIKVLEMAAQTGCPVVTFYNSVGAKLAEGLDVLTASAKLNAQIAKVSGVVPQVAVVQVFQVEEINGSAFFAVFTVMPVVHQFAFGHRMGDVPGHGRIGITGEHEPPEHGSAIV